MSKDAARFTSKTANIVCLSPDVCLTPMGSATIPIPYMIVSKLDWTVRDISNVSFGGDRAFTMDSRTNKVTGDEPGNAGGISSGVNVGWCRPKSNKSSFFIDGKEVLQHDCIYEMNCSGPDGPSNTLGKLNFIDT